MKRGRDEHRVKEEEKEEENKLELAGRKGRSRRLIWLLKEMIVNLRARLLRGRVPGENLKVFCLA